MTAHLSAFGDTEAVDVVSTELQNTNGSRKAPFAVAGFTPRAEVPYYRYVSCLLGMTLINLHQTMEERNLFDICISSVEEDKDLPTDMANFIQYLIMEDVYLENPVHRLIYPIEPEMTVPVLHFIPLAFEDHQWIQEQNKLWGQKLGFRVFREWLEYRNLTPLGTAMGNSLVLNGKENLDKMIQEIGGQMDNQMGSGWYSKVQDSDYVNVFQNFVSHNSTGNTDDEIQKGGSLISTGNFDEAIAHYEALILQRPQEKALYMDQIGAAYFFKQEYHRAMECYIEAAQLL